MRFYLWFMCRWWEPVCNRDGGYVFDTCKRCGEYRVNHPVVAGLGLKVWFLKFLMWGTMFRKWIKARYYRYRCRINQPVYDGFPTTKYRVDPGSCKWCGDSGADWTSGKDQP